MQSNLKNNDREIRGEFETVKQEGLKVSGEVKEKTLGFIITAFGLVAGLAWNEAIQSLIKSIFIIDKDSLWVKFIYAILMTLLLVFITIFLARLFGQGDEKNKK